MAMIAIAGCAVWNLIICLAQLTLLVAGWFMECVFLLLRLYFYKLRKWILENTILIGFFRGYLILIWNVTMITVTRCAVLNLIVCLTKLTVPVTFGFMECVQTFLFCITRVWLLSPWLAIRLVVIANIQWRFLINLGLRSGDIRSIIWDLLFEIN